VDLRTVQWIEWIMMTVLCCPLRARFLHRLWPILIITVDDVDCF